MSQTSQTTQTKQMSQTRNFLTHDKNDKCNTNHICNTITKVIDIICLPGSFQILKFVCLYTKMRPFILRNFFIQKSAIFRDFSTIYSIDIVKYLLTRTISVVTHIYLNHVVFRWPTSGEATSGTRSVCLSVCVWTSNLNS